MEFGKTAGGEAVEKITLVAGELTVSVLTLGAALQSVRMAGVAHDLTLGSENVADYEGVMRYHGTLIAPMVNRIRGAGAVIAGKRHRFEANLDGQHSLHSGASGTHLKLWKVVARGHDFVELALDLPDGEGGFPGKRQVVARYCLAAPAKLRLEITAKTDAPTIFNAANHSYWTLNGAAHWGGHRLRLAAARVLPTDGDFLVTGEISPVAGSDLDFQSERAIAPGAPALDNCFCLADAPQALRDVAWLTSPSGDLKMILATSEAGLQVYDGRNAMRPGRDGYEGLAFEAQGWPDAPNNPAFPPSGLLPGKPVTQITEWRFARF